MKQVRIIGGAWRGRKISFVESEGLRPTPDRVRETVFNWLQNDIGGARCLDLFAGSGALGFEAASRGAEHVSLVEANNRVADQLKQNCQSLKTNQCQITYNTAQQFLDTKPAPFDIVFIDPPYQDDLWQEISLLLIEKKSLAADALIYLECPRRQPLPILPEHWQLLKDKQAGEVRYCLFSNSEAQLV